MKTCIITENRTVVCWGYNGDGRLGNGNTTGVLSPQASYAVNLSKPAVAISGNCALLNDGYVRCWGPGGGGALGDGSKTSSLTPVNVTGIPVGRTVT